MSYGLDLTDCRFLTDHNGNRLRADIPYSMFAMLTEFRSAALRAQTRQIENGARSGNFRGALSVVPPVNGKQHGLPAAASFPLHGAKQSSSLARERGITSSTAKVMPKKVQQVYFPRLFREPIPDEVGRMIGEGIYFLRAWRLYRNYSKEEAADLANITTYTVCRHEHGYNQPSAETIGRFANIYRCSKNQLIAKEGSNTQPFNLERNDF